MGYPSNPILVTRVVLLTSTAHSVLLTITAQKSSPVFTLPSIQPPLRLMLAETPFPRGSGASEVTVGTFV